MKVPIFFRDVSKFQIGIFIDLNLMKGDSNRIRGLSFSNFSYMTNDSEFLWGNLRFTPLSFRQILQTARINSRNKYTIEYDRQRKRDAREWKK